MLKLFTRRPKDVRMIDAENNLAYKKQFGELVSGHDLPSGLVPDIAVTSRIRVIEESAAVRPNLPGVEVVVGSNGVAISAAPESEAAASGLDLILDDVPGDRGK